MPILLPCLQHSCVSAVDELEVIRVPVAFGKLFRTDKTVLKLWLCTIGIGCDFLSLNKVEG